MKLQSYAHMYIHTIRKAPYKGQTKMKQQPNKRIENKPKVKMKRTKLPIN